VDNLRWPNPLRPGGTISVGTQVVSISPSRSRPDHGIVRTDITAMNQCGEAVTTQSPSLWILHRPR